MDEDRKHGLARGAFGFITKSTTPQSLGIALSKIREYAAPRRRRLLVVEDDAADRLSIRALLEHDDIEIEGVGSGKEALAALHEKTFDCVVLDLRLPDMSGFEILEDLSQYESLRDIPIVVFTGKEVTPEEDARCTPLPAASWSKGSSRRSGFWTKPHCFCIAS